MNYKTIKYQVRFRLGSSRLLFPLMHGWKPFESFMVTKHSDVCIEGPPRSANSYAVAVFEQWNPGCTIAHHIHVPMQVIKAVEWQVPCLVLVREPSEALASLLIIDPRLSLNAAFRSYIDFYRPLEAIKDQCAVATFEEVTADFKRVVDRINLKYDRRFNSPGMCKEVEATVFARLEREAVNKPFGSLVVPLPKAHKEELKSRLLPRIIRHPLFDEARCIYQAWCSYPA